MTPAEKKSIRLNYLLQLALKGKTIGELNQIIKAMGVSATTRRDYLNSIFAKLEIMKKRQKIPEKHA